MYVLLRIEQAQNIKGTRSVLTKFSVISYRLDMNFVLKNRSPLLSDRISGLVFICLLRLHPLIKIYEMGNCQHQKTINRSCKFE